MSISSLLSTLILNASARALVGLSRPVSIIAIVLQRVNPDGGHVFLFQNDEDDLAKLHPLLLATDDVTEHAAKQIREVLERRDIDFDHLYLVPEEMSLRPIMNLTLHLAIATVSQEEFIRAKVNNFRSIPVGQVHMHRETNVFFEFVARSHDARALLNQAPPKMVSGDCPIAGEAVLFGYTIVDLDTVPLGPAQELLTPLSAYADKGANDLLVQMARAIKYGPDLLPVSFGDSWK